jgi:hypothetical protein
MSWVLVVVSGIVAWLSIALFFLALCRTASHADDIAVAGGLPAVDVVDLRAFRERRARRAQRWGGAYFNSRDSRRSLSSLPSV